MVNMLVKNKNVTSYDDAICKLCPYWNQRLDGSLRVDRKNVPLGPEINGSDTLLVFQAPGDEECHLHKPLQPIIKPGGTAGRRVELSWIRKRKSRTDYDITNVVQCFPGKKNDGRDKSPVEKAIIACSQRLYILLNTYRYRKVISFGKIANQSTSAILIKYQADIEHIKVPHPNGGLSNHVLDDLWR